MKVLRVINNNVVSCLDGQNQEIVAMGRGLGYSLKPGMRLDESKAEKVFRMESQTQTDRLKTLLASLPQIGSASCRETVSSPV